MLLLVLLLVFAIVAPDADWAHAVDPALAGSALAVAVGTSRAKGEVRRIRALTVIVAALLVVVLVGTGVFGLDLTFAGDDVASGRGPGQFLVRRTASAHQETTESTVQAVAGALAISYPLDRTLVLRGIAFRGGRVRGRAILQSSCSTRRAVSRCTTRSPF